MVIHKMEDRSTWNLGNCTVIIVPTSHEDDISIKLEDVAVSIDREEEFLDHYTLRDGARVRDRRVPINRSFNIIGATGHEPQITKGKVQHIDILAKPVINNPDKPFIRIVRFKKRREDG